MTFNTKINIGLWRSIVPELTKNPHFCTFMRFCISLFYRYLFMHFCTYADKKRIMRPSRLLVRLAAFIFIFLNHHIDLNQIWIDRCLGPGRPTVYILIQNAPSFVITRTTGSIAAGTRIRFLPSSSLSSWQTSYWWKVWELHKKWS